jgi:diadenosine tetraphosphate (Ap4A) HIT family hydrolase
MFASDPRLTRSAAPFLDLSLSTVLLKEDARWPWLIIVPRIESAQELTDLSDSEAARLLGEIRLCARAIAAEPRVERTNIGALGNITRQLHVHVIGRRPGDPCWPGPVWGQGEPEPMTPAGQVRALAAVRTALG